MLLKRPVAIAVAALISGGIVYAISSWDDGAGTVATRLSDHILTLLSILGGIMIAVMAALGDSSFGEGRRFSDGAAQAAGTTLRIGYVHILFWLYLLAILAIMFSGPVELINETAGRCVGQVGNFLGIFSALLSLGLPGFFMRLNQEKVGKRKEEERKAYRDRLG